MDISTRIAIHKTETTLGNFHQSITTPLLATEKFGILNKDHVDGPYHIIAGPDHNTNYCIYNEAAEVFELIPGSRMIVPLHLCQDLNVPGTKYTISISYPR